VAVQQTVTPVPTQTPLFHALNNPRYSRQGMIAEVEKVTGRDLLVYWGHPYASINKSDVYGFGDLLQGKAKADVDLMLQSSGGDIDVAEKLVYLCRSRAKTFRVIVPESAKSAATLIALAGDEIVMSDTSELGPIDPQVIVTTADGNIISRPAQSFLDGLESIKRQADADGRLSPAYFPLLVGLDPALLDYCKKSLARAERFAEKWLKKSQCKGSPAKAKQIAAQLRDTERWLSHGAVIDHTEAKKPGLKVAYVRPEEELWQRVWRLQCRYEVDSQQEKFIKIFESCTISLPLLPT
jgi:hypothetical protein